MTFTAAAEETQSIRFFGYLAAAESSPTYIIFFFIVFSPSVVAVVLLEGATCSKKALGFLFLI